MICVAEMEYITGLMCLANIIALFTTYLLNRRDEEWLTMVKQKNTQILALENELDSLKTTTKDIELVNRSFVRLFADNRMPRMATQLI